VKTALVTGSNGLVGSEVAQFFASKGFRVVGIDNDLRSSFFGADASTRWMRKVLEEEFVDYIHVDADIRSSTQMDEVFSQYGSEISVIIHTAAQPSHDWASRDPLTDFGVNAVATIGMLELTRRHCPDAVFIFTSTNKVYGDTPNSLPFHELEYRWEISQEHEFFDGIDESMSIDQSTHSIFGVSKVAADLMVQEYGNYFGLKTGVFRGGCLTGPSHSGAQLHGFLAYLARCVVKGDRYEIFGHKGKQVRDNLHAYDLANMFWHFYQNPRPGEVYNVGGGRHSNCSVLEGIEIVENVSGKKLSWGYVDSSRIGDHRWYVSNVGKFKSHYPTFEYSRTLTQIVIEIVEGLGSRA
jgi:CDP-paratose 2-epimerase